MKNILSKILKKIKNMTFGNYALSRVVSGGMGILILYGMSDLAGHPAWLVNLIWIPLSWIIAFLIFDHLEGKPDF